MSQNIGSFDPTATLTGNFPTQMGTNPGKILAANHSGVTLLIQLPTGEYQHLWAQTARVFVVDPPVPTINWQQEAVIQGSVGTDHVDLELYSIDEEIEGTFPVSFATPPVISPAGFSSTGILSTGGDGVWVNVSSAATVVLNNWPFNNNEVNSGLAVAGTFFVIIYAISLGMNPRARDGATPEGAIYELRFIVQDSASALVGSTANVILVAPLFAISGGNTPYHEFSSAPGMSIKIACAVGAGPPYTLILQGITVAHLSANVPDASVNISYSVSALPSPPPT